MRTAFAVLSSCVLLALATLSAPAQAGDYYGDGYYRGGYYRTGGGYYDGGHRGYYAPRYSGRSVWYTSNCCYRKVVRHSAHYERIYREGYYDRPYRSGYYDRPYRDGYYGRPYRSSYYEQPYRQTYYDRPYRPAYYDTPRYYEGGYDSYNSASYTDSCYRKRVPLADGRGGWVWGAKIACY